MSEQIEQFLYRYFSGDATSEEQGVILEWIKKSPENRARYKECSEKWALQHLSDIAEKKDKVHIRILNQLVARQEKHSSRIWLTMSRVAAVFILGFSIGLTSILYSGKFSTKSESDNQWYAETFVPNGSKSKTRLPDGSTVWLNAGSRLTYQNDFGNNRTVFLEGEALFEIQADSQNPFRIKTSDMDAVVTGTVLTVKAYHDDPVVTVTLLEGKLRIEQPVTNQTIEMHPNQQVVYEKESGKTTLNDVQAEKYAGWMNGKIYFADETFEVLAKQLERIYDVTIIIKSEKLKNEKFYGSFNESNGILQIMNVLNVQNQLKWTFENEILIISDK